jgi:hypothetical protein
LTDSRFLLAKNPDTFNGFQQDSLQYRGQG